jgi:hypothetical protein
VTDDANEASSAEASGPLDSNILRNRLVVGVVASGPTPPPNLPPGTPVTAPLSDSTFLLTVDADTGKVLGFLTTPEPLPVIAKG